ncbi:MAG TPA: SurA N-terminal domain-containing protein, partial [Candidatus Dojkabacteria bacterium]|nr:SurA N-terminal domain-containing protein [Candidatus Dojkabacteria bacterium]
MAKIKIKKAAPVKTTEKKAPKTVKVPTVKIKKPNIKFQKPDIKKISSSKGFKTFLTVLGVIVAFILIDLFVQYLNNGYSAAVVEGKRIPRSEYIKELETAYGATVIDQLIDEEIIKIEAEKAGVEATEEEVNKQLDQIIESVGGKEVYETVLQQNNIDEEELKNQITLSILANKVLGPTVEYTEDDLKSFFNQYSAQLFPTETEALEEGEKLDYEQYKDQVKQRYIEQKVYENEGAWLEGLRSKYKI